MNRRQYLSDSLSSNALAACIEPFFIARSYRFVSENEARIAKLLDGGFPKEEGR